MPDQQSADFGLLVSHEQLNNAFWRALRMFVGRGKRFSADEVSKQTGVHRRSLDSYRGYPIGHPDHRPLDYNQKFSIASYIGADLTTEWIGFMGQAAYMLPDIEPDPGELAADNADDNATITRAAKDRMFDSNERPELRTVGSRMMARGAQLVALKTRTA